jgi:hypothetical protein
MSSRAKHSIWPAAGRSLVREQWRALARPAGGVWGAKTRVRRAQHADLQAEPDFGTPPGSTGGRPARQARRSTRRRLAGHSVLGADLDTHDRGEGLDQDRARPAGCPTQSRSEPPRVWRRRRTCRSNDSGSQSVSSCSSVFGRPARLVRRRSRHRRIPRAESRRRKPEGHLAQSRISTRPAAVPLLRESRARGSGLTADAPVGVGPNSALPGSPHLTVAVVLAGHVLLGRAAMTSARCLSMRRIRSATDRSRVWCSSASAVSYLEQVKKGLFVQPVGCQNSVPPASSAC